MKRPSTALCFKSVTMPSFIVLQMLKTIVDLQVYMYTKTDASDSVQMWHMNVHEQQSVIIIQASCIHSVPTFLVPPVLYRLADRTF